MGVAYARFRAEIGDARARTRAVGELLNTGRVSNMRFMARDRQSCCCARPVRARPGAADGPERAGGGVPVRLGLSFWVPAHADAGHASVEVQAALYAALLDHLGIDRAVVVAGSAGEPTAIQFAHHYPERCVALVLVSAITMSIAADKEVPNTRMIRAIQGSDFLYWAFTKLFRTRSWR